MNEEKSVVKAVPVHERVIAGFCKNKKEGKTGLKVAESEDIWLLVSLTNGMLSGGNLSAFFEMIARQKSSNQSNSSINKIKILVTDSLNVHYEKNLDDAINLGKYWVSKNHERWESFEQSSGITIELVYWDKLKTNKTEERKEEIKKLYATDEKFQAIVDRLANQHKDKVRVGDGVEKAKDYLFEECAVISCLAGHLCYPDQVLNPALEYVTKYFNSKLIYDGYGIFTKKNKKRKTDPQSLKEKENSQLPVRTSPMTVDQTPPQVIVSGSPEELVLETLKFSALLDKHGIWGPSNQAAFLGGVKELKDRLSSSSASGQSPVNSARHLDDNLSSSGPMQLPTPENNLSDSTLLIQLGVKVS